MSHWKTSARDPTRRARSRRNAASGNPALSPAPRSTTTSMPSFFSAGEHAPARSRRAARPETFPSELRASSRQESSAVFTRRRGADRQPALTSASSATRRSAWSRRARSSRTAVSYSSTSPVVAGTQQVVDARHDDLARGCRRTRSCARAPAPRSRSACDGGICVSSAPWTISTGCLTLSIATAGSNSSQLLNHGVSACRRSSGGSAPSPCR